jgi:hypothetical protein
MTWRPVPFRVGAKYRVKRSVQPLREPLMEGEVLRYERDGCSSYDGMTGCMFRDASKQSRVWELDDNADVESWRDVFEEIQSSEARRGA